MTKNLYPYDPIVPPCYHLFSSALLAVLPLIVYISI